MESITGQDTSHCIHKVIFLGTVSHHLFKCFNVHTELFLSAVTPTSCGQPPTSWPVMGVCVELDSHRFCDDVSGGDATMEGLGETQLQKSFHLHYS